MKTTNGESISVWNDTKSMPQHPTLDEDFRSDVCIVGGGIAGLTTAYLLMKEGKKVCILESSEIGSGQTGRTTAHFSHALDDRFFVLEKYHGEKGLQLAIQSHSAAIKKVQEIIDQEKIECEMEKLSGYLFSKDDKRLDILEKELEAAHRGGLINVEFLNYSPLSFFNTGPCLHFPEQMQLHPMKYLNGLANAIIAGGGLIFTHSKAIEIKGGKNAFVKTSNNSIVYCNEIVVATNTPFNDWVTIHTKQAAYRTYVMAFSIPKNSIPKALFWDTLDPYHYIRTESGSENDLLIVGGEDHKTGQEKHPEDSYTRLEEWTKIRFPMINKCIYQWSGQIMQSMDGLGYLGRNPGDEKNVYILTGDSGNGMTHSTIGAILITDLIQARENTWEKLYAPSRISLRAAGVFLKENSNVANQYTDWVTPKFKPNFDTLEMEEGVVFRDGVELIAAFKNNAGVMEFMTAVCPHLAGVLNWNSAEKSWDCPCHGSRFDCHGKVIEGPANTDLAAINYKDVNNEHIFNKDLQGRFDSHSLE